MNLEEIEEKVGEEQMNKWYSDAIDKGRKEGKQYFQLPSYIGEYVKEQYEKYKSTINES